MKSFTYWGFIPAIVIGVAAPGLASNNLSTVTQRVETATFTLGQFTADSNQRIPASIIRKGQGIAIVPGIVQAGFIFGGRRGAGILLVRNEDGSWSRPAFITVTGGSVGLQIGAQSSDLVLVFNNKLVVTQALSQSFRLGGNVSVAAGPVGGDVVSPTDPSPSVFSYARNAGLFAGVSLEGANLSFDSTSSNTFYGKNGLTPLQIFNNNPPLPTPSVLTGLYQALANAAR